MGVIARFKTKMQAALNDQSHPAVLRGGIDGHIV
jgi:hypothetical protein